MDYFDTFWNLYPRKVAKVVAHQKSKKIQPEEWPNVINGLKKYINAWNGTDRQFIPHPATWLNQRRWEDEIEDTKQVQQESALYTFIKAVRNQNNKVLPDLPHDIKQAFFRIGIPWNRIKAMCDDDIKSVFDKAYNNNQDYSIARIDGKSASSGN